MSSALSFIATSSSGGIALATWRCCQPAASVRLVRTVRKPLSSSMTASRIVCCAFKSPASVCAPLAEARARRELADRAGRCEDQDEDSEGDAVGDEYGE